MKPDARMVDPGLRKALAALVGGTHTDPHSVLGVHDDGQGELVLRAWWPDAVRAEHQGEPMQRIHPAGIFEKVSQAKPSSSSVSA